MRLLNSAVSVIMVLSITLLFSGYKTQIYADVQQDSTQVETQQWGPETNGCIISIWAEKEEFKDGEPIWITIATKNVSDKTLIALESNPDSDYEIQVKNEQGESVPLMLYGTRHGYKARHSKPISRLINIYLDPGKEYEQKVLVSRLYDMSHSGTYFIQVTNTVGSVENLREVFKVKSNIITVKVD